MKIIKKFLLVTMSLIAFAPVPRVFAGGWADEGTSPTGGNCNADANWWWDECFGYAWHSYNVIKDLPASGNDSVHFHYTDETGGLIPLHYCKKGQILYNYGYEVYGHNISLGYQVATMSNKNGKQAPWRAQGSLGAYTDATWNNNTTGNYLQSRAYASVAVAKEKYDKMVAYDKANGTNFTHDTTWWNVGYFCFDTAVEEVNLKAYAWNTTKPDSSVGHNDANQDDEFCTQGNLLNSGKTIDSKKVAPGSSATVSRSNFNPDGYTYTNYWCWKNTNGKWKYWKNSTNVNEYTDTIKADTDVRAIYQRNSFQGRADVAKGTSYADAADGDKISTGWQSGDKDAGTLGIDCPDDGCKARFVLRLKTVAGNGSTVYTIKKDGTALSDYSSKTINPKTDADGPPKCSSGSCWVAFTEDMVPGETICYSVVFRPYGSKANDGTSEEKACAKAEPTIFEGKTSVTGSSTGTTDWNSVTKTARVIIPNCSPINGCKIAFNHRLRRKDNKGSGTSKYIVSRTSNLTSSASGRAIANNDNLTSGPFSGAETEVYRSGDLTLYPGMVVCEKLSFLPNNEPNTIQNEAYVYVRVCVSAEGDGQPPDPDPDEPENPDSLSGDTSYLNIKVRNASVTKYNNYQRSVYAKPGDNLDFRAVYNPNLQYTYYLKPQKLRINGGTIYPDGATNAKTMGAYFNELKGSLDDWNNAFGITRSGFQGNNVGFKNTTFVVKAYELGSTSRRQEKDPSEDGEHYLVVSGDVGRELKETARLNGKTGEDGNSTTPTQVSFKDTDGSNVGNVITNGNVGNTAKALVPYNFRTSTTIEFPNNSDDKFPAGENGTAKIYIDVKPKGNSYTTNSSDEEYATKVSQAKLRLILYVPGSGTTKVGSSSYGDVNSNLCDRYSGSSVCDILSIDENSTYNSSGLLDGKRETRNATFLVPDLDAGAEVCVAAANYPSTSGADTNLNASGDGRWNVSDSRCFKIYKKPSVQVWGGGVYSAGKLNVPFAAKKHVAGINDYGIKSNNSYYVFGTWGELELVSMGVNTGFGSGASMGYVSNSGGLLSPSYNSDNPVGTPPGGSLEATLNFCLRSPLTFANTSNASSLVCTSSTPALGASGTNVAEGNKSSLVARFVNVSEAEKEKIKYFNVNNFGDLVASGSNSDIFGRSGNDIVVKKGKTVVVDATASVLSRHFVNISNNIVYEDGYTSLDDIPKLIIIADNILVNCDVTRIDAILIANTRIDTCQNSSDVNAQANSNQLIINGTVITNTMDAKRTYGAAKGSNAIIPAEIINYDTTLYLWGSSEADVSESGKLNETYTHELSPRF